jgi:hypothetical protein
MFGNGPANEEWDTPVPLDATSGPPFPVEALPDSLSAYVRGLAAFAEVPPDLPALLVLATCAAAIARKVRIRVRDGYGEPLNLFAVVAMPPGTRKSSVFADVTEPLNAYERELLDTIGPEIAEAESRARVRQSELKEAEAKAAKGGVEGAKWDRARRELARQIREAAIPSEPRVLMSEATPEAIARGLAEQGGRLAVFSPEGDVLALLRRYSKDGAPNVETFLKGHTGDELRVDRRGAPPVTVSLPALTVGLAVQPDVLQGLAHDRTFRERGLLARFMYAVPPSLVGARTFDGPAVPDVTQRRYTDAVLWLCRYPAQSNALTLDAEALRVWRTHALLVEQERQPSGRYAAMPDWTGKLPGLVARLAGILHSVKGASSGCIPQTVEADTMQASVRIGEYAAAHALVAFGLMGADPALAGASLILECLRRTRHETFTTRDTYRENRSLTPAAARLSLAVLEARGWIRRALDPTRDGRPSERWGVHPGLWGDALE